MRRRGAVVGVCTFLTFAVWSPLAPAMPDDGPTTRLRESAVLAAPDEPAAPLAQPRRKRRARPGSVYDGIPWDTAAVALLLSAAIGAAGAKIYVGITGPDD
jgi:hypothetical protein